MTVDIHNRNESARSIDLSPKARVRFDLDGTRKPDGVTVKRLDGPAAEAAVAARERLGKHKIEVVAVSATK